jgi:hypothetical protein
MKRVDIRYNGAEYSIGNRHVDDVQAEVDTGLLSPEPAWLTVNSGEGRIQMARLLITPGACFTLIGVEDPDMEEE